MKQEKTLQEVKNSTNIKKRVLYFIEKQNIVKENFYTKISSNGGNFRGKSLKSELQGSKIVEILSKYPELSADWLILGQGEMLRSSNQTTTEKSNLNNDVNVLKKVILSQQKTIKDLSEANKNLSESLKNTCTRKEDVILYENTM